MQWWIDYMGMGDESKKDYEQARKRYIEAVQEREEAVRQAAIEDDKIDQEHGIPHKYAVT